MSMQWVHKVGTDHGNKFDYDHPSPSTFAEIVDAINDDDHRAPDGGPFDAQVALMCFRHGAQIYYREKKVRGGPSDKDLEVVDRDWRTTDPAAHEKARSLPFAEYKAALRKRFYEMADE